MLYIYLDTHQIKLLYLKKSLLGAYEASFFSMPFDAGLVENGKPSNVDLIDSAIKKLLESVPEQPLKEKEVTLILPQEAFTFSRLDMPADITSSVVDSYIKEKARTMLGGADPDSTYYDYLVQESEHQKKITLYALQKDTAQAFEQPFSLLDLKLVNIIPETLAYFKLFEKTLRANKTENVWYVSFDNNRLLGYVYDSFGLLENDKWYSPVQPEDKIELPLQKKASEYQEKNIKLNRLILSGKQSSGIRQDTFTKEVGVWTNPLFRIIPHFYADYVKLLQHQGAELPVVEYDVLVGAFIFSQENKNFSLFSQRKSSPGKLSEVTSQLNEKKLPIKNILFFLISFIATFCILYVLSQMNFKLFTFSMPSFSLPKSVPFLTKSTPTPIPSPTPSKPTPTPTPSVKREDVRIKVLNGSGIAGKASEVKTFFSGKGYEEILTANADEFDFEITVIQIKKDKEKVLKPLIAGDIASQVSKPTFETLDEEEASDVVIIVGTDFK